MVDFLRAEQDRILYVGDLRVEVGIQAVDFVVLHNTYAVDVAVVHISVDYGRDGNLA